MPKRLLSLVAAVVVSLFPTCRVAGAALSDDWIWRTEVVDVVPPGTYLGDVSLALDSQDQAHIGYYESRPLPYHFGGWCSVRYAHQIGPQGWSTETVTPAAGANLGSWGSLSLAPDPDNSPHFAYWRPYTLEYARLDGATWLTHTVDSLGGGFIWPVIAVDSTFTPHIAYSVGYSVGIRYATMEAGVWGVQELPAVWGGQQPLAGLALDTTDSPHIVFFDADPTAETLTYFYAVRDGAVWNTEVITVTSWDWGAAFALGPADAPYLVYRQPNSIVLAVRETSGWSFTDVGVAGSPRTLSLVVADDGTPHISGHNAEGLVYVYRDGDGWHSEVVVPAAGLWSGSSIGIDSSSRLHIAYMVADDHNSGVVLKHAVRTFAPYHAHLPLVMRLD